MSSGPSWEDFAVAMSGAQIQSTFPFMNNDLENNG